MHDMVQKTPVAVSKRSQECTQHDDISPSICNELQRKNIGLLPHAKSRPMGRAGVEQIPKNIPQPLAYKEVKQNSPKDPVTQRVHDRVHKEFTPELQQIVEQWDTLPEYIKAAMTALLRTGLQ